MKQIVLFFLFLLAACLPCRAQYWIQCGGSQAVDEGMDVDAYRAERLKAFVAMLRHFDLVKPPVV